MNEEQIAELITRRRRQVWVHSVIYYRMNENIISDHQWSAWAFELAELQRLYPEIAAKCPYAEEFKKFDGSSGFDLPLTEPWVVDKARYLLWLTRKTHAPL